MKKFIAVILLVFGAVALGGCDRIYGVLHKPGGEERKILGEVVFNEYNPKVEEVQKDLRLLGYHIGRPDGKFGAGTRAAVAAFQSDEVLEVTRFVDKLTWAHLQVYVLSRLVDKGALSGRAIQMALQKAGYGLGKIDGQLGKQTKVALKAFQSAHGLKADGMIGLATFRELLKELPEK